MKVTNNSDANISDVEIEEIVRNDVRINLFNRTEEMIVSSDCFVTLVVKSSRYANGIELCHVGKLNKKMRWGLDGHDDI